MHSVLVKCDNCDGLSNLLSKIECTLLYLAKKKHAILVYNLEDNFDSIRFKDLVAYKRILSKRMFNCNYPCDVKTSTLIAKISQLAFRGPNCSECETCFPELPNTDT